MPKFHVTRTVRTYDTHLLSGERTGEFSDSTSEFNVPAKNSAEAEAKARSEGGNFLIDEIVSVVVDPFDDWMRGRKPGNARDHG